MAEVTMRLQIEFPPELLAGIREMVRSLEKVGEQIERAFALPPALMRHAIDPVVLPQALEKLREVSAKAPSVVPTLKPVSGVGERQDDVGEGVHLAPTSPSPTISSLHSPGADVLPASFCAEPAKKGARVNAVWNEGRDAALARLRTSGEKWPEIFRRLKTLPGGEIANENAVEKRWYKLKSAGAVERLLKHNAPAVRSPGGDVRMSISEARQWASSRGLCNGHGAALDMKLVNAKRVALGLPKIVLEGR